MHLLTRVLCQLLLILNTTHASYQQNIMPSPLIYNLLRQDIIFRKTCVNTIVNVILTLQRSTQFPTFFLYFSSDPKFFSLTFMGGYRVLIKMQYKLDSDFISRYRLPFKSNSTYQVCPFYIVSYCMKWVTTTWAYIRRITNL